MGPHHQANRSRLLMAILLFSVILLAEFVSDLRLPDADSAPPPLAAIVAVSVAHLDRSLDLGRNLLELSNTFGFADYRRENECVLSQCDDPGKCDVLPSTASLLWKSRSNHTIEMYPTLYMQHTRRFRKCVPTCDILYPLLLPTWAAR